MEDTATGRALIEKGRQRHAREAIVRILRVRVGEVPVWVVERLASIRDLETLDTILERAAQADASQGFDHLF